MCILPIHFVCIQILQMDTEAYVHECMEYLFLIYLADLPTIWFSLLRREGQDVSRLIVSLVQLVALAADRRPCERLCCFVLNRFRKQIDVIIIVFLDHQHVYLSCGSSPFLFFSVYTAQASFNFPPLPRSVRKKTTKLCFTLNFEFTFYDGNSESLALWLLLTKLLKSIMVN